ncbi:MAG: hypothetical protein A2X28_05730 [Elusimicrobia bacterium GWA2_56_46]|nr:MAG: hypothetical protein A2X28_05730 [Elusimicrobia bacterium GWA2_56_46]OGR56021.1 MAG: hypothetical protein A2X39_03170 [Elusimicrobia bacterium GWC2_56_31]HBW23240.1 hypothetical protein [Elusimicrobiota bacterium]
MRIIKFLALSTLVSLPLTLNAIEFEIMDRLTVDGAAAFKSTVTVIVPATQPTELWVSTSAETPHLFVSTAGNVGLGTPVPGAKLEVAGQVKITGGTPGAGKVLTSDGAGLATWETAPVGAGDNLGNHVATTTLSMADFDITNVSTVTVSTISLRGAGAGVVVSTNLYVNGDVHAARIYGDLTGATGFPAAVGDNLGNHVATTTLDMDGFGIVDAGSITSSSYTATGTGIRAAQLRLASNVLVSSEAAAALGGGVRVSTNAYVAGFVYAGRYLIGGSNALSFLSGTGSLGVGAGAGSSNTGNYNSFVGYQAGAANTSGENNSFTGYRAGYSNTTGYQNVANGPNALYSNQAGYSNTALGFQALYSINGANGFQNTAVGANALYSETAATGGYNNTAVGVSALNHNNGGFENVAVGNNALLTNEVGQRNAAVGASALYSNTSGGNNVAIGQDSLRFNQTGSDNTVIGSEAAYSAAGHSFSNTTILGSYAGRSLTNGSADNTFLGYRAGYSVTTGSHNVLVGFNAGDSLTSGWRNIIIGYDKDAPTATTSNHLNIGGAIYGNLSTGNIGIGQPAPAAKLDVAGTIKITGGSPGAGKVLTSDGVGLASWGTASGDNLGNHVATMTLNMATFNLVNVGSITANAAITTYSSMTVAGNITAARYQINGSTVLAILPGIGSMVVGANAGVVNTGDYNVFVGSGAGRANTTGYDNLFVGYSAGTANTTGYRNTFLGSMAGRANTTGYGNSFVGLMTGYANDIGVANSFIGYAAGNDNTSGASNTFLGYLAGQSNTTGSDNTFIGRSAGLDNTVGARNSFVGNYAGSDSVSGNDNTALGWYAGLSNQTGKSNAIVGSKAGYYAKTGSANSIYGMEAGYGVIDNSFSSSTLMGYRAGYALTTGSDNILLGFQAGDSLTSGTRNIIIGYDKDAPLATTSNHLNIGDAIYGDLSTGFIGIGAPAPGARLEVNGQVKITGGTPGAGKVLTSDAAGLASWVAAGSVGDNLGNHVATTTLNMNGNSIVNVASATFTGGITASSFTATGAGLIAAQLRLAGNVFVSSESAAAVGAGVRISTNVYIVGFSSAAKYYGDGSSLTGTGDNLGNHNAAMRLNMGGYAIWSSSDITAARYQIFGSTVLAVLPGTGSLAVGVDAGKVSTGDYNVFVGSAAGLSSTTGEYNSFVGVGAGRSNTTGGYNNFVGGSAGYSNITGSYNNFMGTAAGVSNTTGANNIFVGHQAGYYTQTGSANAVFGYQAGLGSGVNSFSSATLVGYQAGYSLTTGSDNILLGFQAGDALTSGTRNIIVGYDQNVSAPGASNELNIGGVLYGDLSAKTIGISTRVPQAALDIVSTGTLVSQYAQIWRDSTGLVVASMTANGKLYTTIPPTGDNLGNHTATTHLDMSSKAIFGVSSMTITGAGMSGAEPLFTVASSTFNVLANGNVGVGIANPTNQLEIKNPVSATNMQFDTSNPAYVTLMINGAPVARLKP